MKTTMGILKLMIHVLALMVFLPSCRSFINGVSPQFNDDVLGLIVFKSDLHDPSSYLETWNEDDESPCKWRFISCNPENGRVSEISLDGLGLSGRLGRGLERLQYLKVLSLTHNNFNGDLSSETVLPSSLQRIDLSFNNFSGPIASFVKMASIRFIDLSENTFAGNIEDVLFENCSSLHFLSLSSNKLEGPLPSSLSQCILLNTLNLSSNHFSGQPEFSSGIWKLRRLRTLDLSNNAFSGVVHQGISALHFLKVLLLHTNQFSGSLPGDLGLCPHLEKLDFSDNLLSGSLPRSMNLLNSLSFISLANNLLTGDFPPWISNMRSLEYIDFSSNDFTGILPSSLTSCRKLSVLHLEGNSFNGGIPDGLFELSLEEIDFSNNRFTGLIPDGSSKLHESLRKLDLSKNNFTGSFPEEMGQFINLRHLNLSWNNLKSKIQPELGLLHQLAVLDLRNNGVYGSIPVDMCDSENLQILQLDENSLTGSIPDEIGLCSSLNLLSLSSNDLSGSIPNSISKLKKLKILRLERNKLSGEIPQELGILTNLLVFNISFNRLIGRLPVGGIFQSLDQSSLQGNLGICSPLLKGPCTMNVSKPLFLDPDAYSYQMGGHKQRGRDSESENSNRHVLLSVSAIIAIAAAILIAFGVIIISFLNASVRRKLEFLESAIERSSMSSKSGNVPTGKLILFDSETSPNWTRNPETLLNKGSEIGSGVFGTVYKVSLGNQGPFVAIKKLVSSNPPPNSEEFDREVRILAMAKHPNLIALKGYYLSPQTQLLLSDYASNGSLQTLLHERISSTAPLSWSSRLKIIHSTAKGLAYLHHSFNPPIIHYSLRPNNILFDENYNVKISDFGQARLLNKLNKHVINSRFQSTWGYVAPELACQSLRVDEKCDVYCFGVITLELVTGKRPVEYGEDNVVILKDHVRVLLEHGNALDCVDPSMREFSENEVLPVLKLALVCTSQLPSSRPSMAEVVHMLELILSPDSQRIDYGNSVNQNSDST